MFNADIAPNFSMSFDARVPNWSANSFKYGIHSELQSFYFACPSNSQLQMQDVNFTPLTNFTLNPSYLLSNGVYNSFNIVNRGSNLIATVNGYPYVAKVPNYRYILNSWPNSTFSFSACNSGPITGSNSIRRLHAQSITSFSDPIIANNSITAQLVNSGKIGTTELQSRVIDTQVSFTDYAFTSNLFCTSNTALSNVAASNVVVRHGLAASNITASNMIVNSFTACNATFPIINSSSSGSFANLTTQRANVNNVLHMNNQIQNCTISLFSTNPNATPSNSDTNYLGFGVNNGMLRYNVNDPSDNHVFFQGSNERARITGTGRLGIGTNPAYTLDVNGTCRISSNLIVFPATLGNASVVNNASLLVTHPINTATNTLNDPQNVLVLSRGGTSSQSFSASCKFALCRYENASTSSRTRMDIDMLHTTDSTFTNVMTMRSDGNVGIGTTAPTSRLDVNGAARVNGDVLLTNANSIHLGVGVTKQTDAGRIGYETFTAGSLDIVGAGTVSGSRQIKMWDNVTVEGNVHANSISTSSTFSAPTVHATSTLNIGSSSLKGVYCGYATIGSSGGTLYNTVTVTHGWNLSGQQFFSFSERDLVTPLVVDTHGFKVTAVTANSFDLLVTRSDQINDNSWTRSFTLMYTIIVT